MLALQGSMYARAYVYIMGGSAVKLSKGCKIVEIPLFSLFLQYSIVFIKNVCNFAVASEVRDTTKQSKAKYKPI